MLSFMRIVHIPCLSKAVSLIIFLQSKIVGVISFVGAHQADAQENTHSLVFVVGSVRRLFPYKHFARAR